VHFCIVCLTWCKFVCFVVNFFVFFVHLFPLVVVSLVVSTSAVDCLQSRLRSDLLCVKWDVRCSNTSDGRMNLLA